MELRVNSKLKGSDRVSIMVKGVLVPGVIDHLIEEHPVALWKAVHKSGGIQLRKEVHFKLKQKIKVIRPNIYLEHEKKRAIIYNSKKR